MGVRLHMTLMIGCTIAAVGVCSYAGLRFASAPFWWILGLPVLVFACEVFFRRLVPARCPDCGRRTRCAVISRDKYHHGKGETRSLTIIRYACPDCGFRFPTA